MAMFISQTMKHSSPTTTVLADGYTDDALASKYDNFRASRPYSRESILSGTSLGSKVRLSQFSLLSRPDAALAEEENYEESNIQRREQKSLLQAHVLKMFAGQFSRTGSIESDDHSDQDNSTKNNQHILPPPPKSFLGKAKYYYDKYKLHRISACVCLIFYSFLGAWLFYIIEHEYEKEVKGKERIALRNLRNNTFQKISLIITNRKILNFEKIFIEYEKELHKVQLPECLDWDYWGALFYVGTLFTTIGYGNITPRTATGRALSVIYAIIGIPLVLAILSKCGKWLTKTLSVHWQQHRRRIKMKAKKTTNRLRGKITKSENLELGLNRCQDDVDGDEEMPESRTIPIWLALLICVLFVCGCSSLFLIWETRWTFFTSLYFFCISLSTIGLGDIVPDHPHMFIIMFVLVIMGLSIVSMLLSVIQIKMEEWLYHLIKKIQQEYNRALENGEIVDREGVFRNVMSNEPTWMQLVAPTILTGQQNDKLEQKVEQFERLLKESKDVQTDISVAYAGTQVEKYENSMACDPMSVDHLNPQNRETQWSKQSSEHLKSVDALNGQLNVASKSYDYRDSISDATSLPLDSISQTSPPKRCRKCAKLVNEKEFCDGLTQTDLAQFQIDEIAMRLANLQTQRVRPPIVERSMATSAHFEDSIKSDLISPQNQLSQEDINAICCAMTSSFHRNEVKEISTETDDDLQFKMNFESENTNLASTPIQTSNISTSTDRLNRSTSCSIRSIATSPIFKNSDRSFATSPIPMINITEDDETQTSIQERIDVSTDPCSSDLIDRSTVTTPIEKPHFFTETIDRMSSPVNIETIIRHDQNTSPIQNSDGEEEKTEYDDRSMQTSIVEWFGKIFQKKDESQQTSTSEDLDLKSKKKRKKIENDISQSSSLGSQCASLSSESASTSEGSKSKKNQKAKNSAAVMSASVTMSTQYSPPPNCNESSFLCEPSHRARSSSTSGMGTSIFDEENRQEVIVQTDDSYLKIARRLDEYRHNKTQFLPVCAASPLSSKEVEPFKNDRASERSHYYFGGMGRKLSLGRSRKKSKNQEINHRESQTGQSMDSDLLTEVLDEENQSNVIRKKSVNFTETSM